MILLLNGFRDHESLFRCGEASSFNKNSDFARIRLKFDHQATEVRTYGKSIILNVRYMSSGTENIISKGDDSFQVSTNKTDDICRVRTTSVFFHI